MVVLALPSEFERHSLRDCNDLFGTFELPAQRAKSLPINPDKMSGGGHTPDVEGGLANHLGSMRLKFRWAIIVPSIVVALAG